MDNFLAIQDRLLSLADESDQEIEYNFFLFSIESMIINGWSEEDITIKELIDSVAETEQPEMVTALFDEYHIENGYPKFVIASFIFRMFTYENIFLAKYPELIAEISDTNDNFDEKNIDTYLETINRYLSLFNDNDVALVRRYMDAIMQDTISDFE
jgi:hypothetical protein